MICTFYSHQMGFDRICDCLKENYPTGILNIEKQGESDIAIFEIKRNTPEGSKFIKIAYRQKEQPSYQFSEVDDSPLSKNLRGLYGFVSSLPSDHEMVKNLFLHKIQTLNVEFSLMEDETAPMDLKPLIHALANELDAVIFVQTENEISKSVGPHFLDRNLDLIIDKAGKCEINNLDIVIDSIYFDQMKEKGFTKEQTDRKVQSEQLLEKHQIKINSNLAPIQSEEATTIRTPKEIAQRVTILAITNQVAFNGSTGEKSINYLKKHFLWNLTTQKEKDFLANPTPELKNFETWKCEDIWVLLWAINKVDSLPFPDKLCNLNEVLDENYPITPNKDPNDYINKVVASKSKKAILDAADLYYRLDWASVDARVNKKSITGINPGVIYERHYALNWLIGYKGQAWDDVSCDT